MPLIYSNSQESMSCTEGNNPKARVAAVDKGRGQTSAVTIASENGSTGMKGGAKRANRKTIDDALLAYLKSAEEENQSDAAKTTASAPARVKLFGVYIS